MVIFIVRYKFNPISMSVIIRLIIFTLALSTGLFAQNQELSSYQRKAMNTERFAQPVNTGLNHTLLILGSAWEVSPELGDEIAVYDSKKNMVASVAWRPEQKGHAGLAIWGDDETTTAKEGMTKGENFSIQFYDKSEDRMSQVQVKRWERGNEEFTKDGVSVVGALTLNKELEQNIELFQNVPNPVTDNTEISFYLPQDRKIRLSVSNTLGQEVKTLAATKYNKGMHTLAIDATSLSAGVYFYKLEGKKSSVTKQLNIIK